MTYVLLSKAGDILAALPFLKHEADVDSIPTLMVGKSYAPILEGATYVKPIVWEGTDGDLGSAFGKAKEINPAAKSLQVNGPPDHVRDYSYRPNHQESAVTTSWQKEIWRLAGYLHKWDECWPLVFNNRDPKREAGLLKSVKQFGWRGRAQRPIILVSVNGKSSPFQYKDLLVRLVQAEFKGKYHVVELPQAERLYDLLALYERAACLISTDSAPLHLAWACPGLPVVALTNDKPLLWNGSSWRPNCVFYCRYSDWPARAGDMLGAIDRVASLAPRDTYKRHSVAIGLDLAIAPGMCGRDSAIMLRDPERIPYLRDVLRMGLQKADRILSVRRPGVEFNFPDSGVSDTAYAYRMNGQKFAPIADYFHAPVEFWRKVLPDVPDVLFGSDYYWSDILAGLFRKHGAADITGCVSRLPSEGKKVADPSNPPPRIAHNFALWQEWKKQQGIYARYPPVTEQVATVPFERGRLHPNGYNPTIIEDLQGGIFMAYRYHTDSLASKIAIARLSTAGEVVWHHDQELNGFSLEDPRFFFIERQHWMSWVEAYWPVKAQGSVRYGIFRNGHCDESGRPDYGENDGNHLEKNWVWFWHKDAIYFIYRSNPQQVTVRFSGQVEQEYVTEGPQWGYGEIKGGTMPLEYDGNLLRFFHSTLDNEFANAPFFRRYFIGACLMEPEPPFKVVATSSKPIIYGSELPARPEGCIHWKPQVVFCSGAVKRDGSFLLSLGCNDCGIELVTVKPEQLNL